MDLDSPDHVRFPLFGDVEGWDCELRAGDMLFIPAFFWHQVVRVVILPSNSIELRSLVVLVTDFSSSFFFSFICLAALSLSLSLSFSLFLSLSLSLCPLFVIVFLFSPFFFLSFYAYEALPSSRLRVWRQLSLSISSLVQPVKISLSRTCCRYENYYYYYIMYAVVVVVVVVVAFVCYRSLLAIFLCF